MEIWWIRHGESNSNAGERTETGRTAVLSERGWAEARTLPRAFAQAPDLIVTSPMIRTKQTAQPLLECFPQVPQAEWAVQEFCELADARRFNTTGPERKPMVDAYWHRLDPDYHDGQGAESFKGLITRVDAAIEQMRQLGSGLTVVFCHGLFMRALLWRMFSQPTPLDSSAMKRYIYFHQSLWIPNAGIVRIKPIGDQWYISPPDTNHLGDLQPTLPNEWLT